MEFNFPETEKNNVTKLHAELADRALVWLSNKVTGRGMRSVLEFMVTDGYVADAFALCSLQWRFYDRYSKLSEYNYFSYIFEAKATRSDFISTFNESEKHKNRKEPYSNFHYCVTPRNLIKTEELPPFWGLLEIRGLGLTETKPPHYNDVKSEQYLRWAETMLWTGKSPRTSQIFKCPYCENKIKESEGK